MRPVYLPDYNPLLSWKWPPSQPPISSPLLGWPLYSLVHKAAGWPSTRGEQVWILQDSSLQFAAFILWPEIGTNSWSTRWENFSRINGTRNKLPQTHCLFKGWPPDYTSTSQNTSSHWAVTWLTYSLEKAFFVPHIGVRIQWSPTLLSLCYSLQAEVLSLSRLQTAPQSKFLHSHWEGTALLHLTTMPAT